MESKRKRLHRSQMKEVTRTLELRQTHSDVQQLTKVTSQYVDQELQLHNTVYRPSKITVDYCSYYFEGVG